MGIIMKKITIFAAKVKPVYNRITIIKPNTKLF